MPTIPGTTASKAPRGTRRSPSGAAATCATCWPRCFVSRGTPMLAMGDELGRTQQGNNNAYVQDNALAWVDWAHADDALIAFTSALIAVRRTQPALRDDRWLTGGPSTRAACRTCSGCAPTAVPCRTATGTIRGCARWSRSCIGRPARRSRRARRRRRPRRRRPGGRSHGRPLARATCGGAASTRRTLAPSRGPPARALPLPGRCSCSRKPPSPPASWCAAARPWSSRRCWSV